MATKDIIFSVSSDNEFRVRLPMWSSSSNNFLLYLRDDVGLIDDLTYISFWRSPKTQTYPISDKGATKIRQIANKLGLQIIPNLNIRNTKAS